MKIYSGDPGPPMRVTVCQGNGKPRPIKYREPAHADEIVWGESTLGAFRVALAILDDVLGNTDRALILAQRFKWRIVVNWKPEQPWSITEEAVLATVADIEKTERDTAQGRRIAALEPPPIMNGGLGGDMGWSSEPKLKPNLPERKQ